MRNQKQSWSNTKMVSFFGTVVGLLTLFVPTLFWPRKVPRLPSRNFMKQYPDKKWLYYVHLSLPILWILLYLLIILPLLWQIGDEQLYLVSFAIGGGLAAVHGIIEILSSVSMRNFSRGGPATYLVDDAVKRLGWIRLGSVLFFGTVPWAILSFFS
jgi:hypothetical protein